MTAESLRAEIAETRRKQRRAEAELNRIGMVRKRLSEHRDRLERGLETPTEGRPPDEAGTDGDSGSHGAETDQDSGDEVVSAFERLVRPDDGDAVDERREALSFLDAPLFDVESVDRRRHPQSVVSVPEFDDDASKATGSFFDRATDYRHEVGASRSASWWHVVEILKRFLGGDLVGQSVVEGVEHDVQDRGTAESLDHLETVFGFAATAARRYRDRIEARLASEFDGTEITDPGLLQEYLDAIGDDPFAELAEQPVVMLPVRLETRFERTGSEVEGDLMVRVYPEQIHVHTHEEELTDEEVTWGTNFWAYLWYACHPEYDLTKYNLAEKFGFRPEVTVPFPFGDRLQRMIDDVDPEAFPEPPHGEGRRMAEEWYTSGKVELSASGESSGGWVDDRYDAIKERAWRQVVERFGRERASYVVHALAPDPDGRQLLAGPRVGHGRWGLSFPDVSRRPEAWTARPTAELLPDQWILHGTWHGDEDGGDGDDSKTVHHVTVRSNAVREPLAVGPDPESVATMGEGTGGDGGDGDTVPPELEWMVDFEEAVRAGMAMRVTGDDLGAGDKLPTDGRFESLVVYGVKRSMSGEESVEAVREALDAHQHTQGLEFLEPGTPTNNADVESGYSSDEDPGESMDVEVGEPLVEDGDYSDGDVLARALGIDPDDGGVHPFAHVENADMTTDREARHVNNAMWPATLGYYLKHVLVGNRWYPGDSIWVEDEEVTAEPPVTDDAVTEEERVAEMHDGLAWLDAYRRHFVKYVRGDGPFPALRVGNQPYGVLPATPHSTQCDDDSFGLFDPKVLSAVATGEDEEDGGGVSLGTPLATSVNTDESVTRTYNLAGDVVGGTDEDESGNTAREPEAEIDSGTGGSSAADSTSGTPADATRDDRDVKSERPEALADGTGAFVPRKLDRVDDDFSSHFHTWVDKFAGIWRDAVDPETIRLVGEGDSAEERPAVPRVGDIETVDEDTLLDILEMESMAGDYLRRAVFGAPDTLATAIENNPDISEEEERQVLQEADPELLGDETDPYKSDSDLEDEGPEGLTDALRGIEHLQKAAVRETLKRYDMTELDPVIADRIYYSVFPEQWSYRTIETLVDDDIRANAWLLTQLSYDDLLTMGYGFDPDRFGLDPGSSPAFVDEDYASVASKLGEGSREKQAIHDKMDLINEHRTSETEPVVQKSLLRVLLSFGTMHEFVSGRLKLGALYDDPVERGPDPASDTKKSEPPIRSWRETLEDEVPEALKKHPGLEFKPGPDSFSSDVTYKEAVDLFRKPHVSGSPVPSLRDFTFSVNQVSSYSVDRLDTVLTQTLDLASYRLDAWWTSAGTRRLFELRTAQGNWTDEHRVEDLSGEPFSLRGVDVEEERARYASDIETDDDVRSSIEPGQGQERSPEMDQASFDASGRQWQDGRDGSIQTDVDIEGAGREESKTYGDEGGSTSYTPDEEHTDVSREAIEFPDDERDWWTGDHVEPVEDDPAVYVGAYAFGEDLVPDQTGTDAEYIHAPSLQQATTAALLRSGHQSHEESSDELAEMLSVDLSGERVRLARSLLEGVQNGQSLGALLGYRFERALHEADENLQEYIADFREVAPAVSGTLKHDERAPAGVGEEAAKSDVVDGYRLYRMWKGRADTEIPWDSDRLGASRDDFAEPFDRLERAIDSLRDLLTAESVHQLAQGNVERASASVDAIADGRLPPEPEVIETPRSSVGLTHRQLVLFGDAVGWSEDDSWAQNTDDTTSAYLELPEPDEVEPPETSERSTEETVQVRPAAEPVLNGWLEALFPDPKSISCTVLCRWTEDAEGDEADERDERIEGEGDREQTYEPTLADLDLSPLDALYLTQVDERPGDSQLERRVAYYVRRETARGDATIDIRFREAKSDDHVSMAEFIELAGSVRSLVFDGRPARGDDVGRPSHSPGDGYTVDSVQELQGRANDVETLLDLVRYKLRIRATLLDPPDDVPNLLERVDDAVDAAERFADEVPMDRVTDSAAEVADRVPAATGGADESDVVYEELAEIAELLPAGPTGADAVEAEHRVVPTGTGRLSGDVSEYHGTPTEDLPDEIQLRIWSRSITSAFERTLTAEVVPDGSFEAEGDFRDVDPGTPFRVVGVDTSSDVAAGAPEVVYSARGRVVGDGPAPEAFTSAFSDGSIGSDGRSVVAALLDLARDRSKLSPTEDGPARDLQTAVDDVPWSAEDASPTVLSEFELQETLAGNGEDRPEAESEGDGEDSADADGGSDGLLSFEVEPGVVEDTKSTLRGLLDDVDLSSVSDSLDDAIEPLDRVGLADLVTVTRPSATERQLYRGSDRTAGTVRERLIGVLRDPTVLSEAVIGEFDEDSRSEVLRFDPRVTGTLASLDDPNAVLEYLTGLLDHPDWFPGYLDEFVDRPAWLLEHLERLVYHPETVDEDTKSELRDSLESLVDAAGDMDRLEDLFSGAESDAGVVDHRVEFEHHVGAFVDRLPSIDDPPVESPHESVPGTNADLRDVSLLDEQLASIEDVVDADDPNETFRNGVLETVRIPLLRASYFGVYGSVPSPAVGGEPADEGPLAAQARSVSDRITERIDDADQASARAAAAVGSGDYGQAVEACVERLQALLGDTFTVLPPFVPPARSALSESFRADLLDEATVGEDTLPAEPLAPETWLQEVARVRDRPARFREALSYAEALNGTLLRDLRVAQLPAGDGPWVGRDGVTPDPGQVSIVAQAATGFGADTFETLPSDEDPPEWRPAGHVTGLFVDEWLERVPEQTETTGVALNYDDPGNRAPQSILLAAPPESGGWTERDLRTVVSETLGLAKLRMVDLEALANVDQSDGIDLLLPGLWFPRTFDHPPKEPSVDFETLERLFDSGPGAVEWAKKKWLESMFAGVGDAGEDGSTDGDGGDEG